MDCQLTCSTLTLVSLRPGATQVTDDQAEGAGHHGQGDQLGEFKHTVQCEDCEFVCSDKII